MDIRVTKLGRPLLLSNWLKKELEISWIQNKKDSADGETELSVTVRGVTPIFEMSTRPKRVDVMVPVIQELRSITEENLGK